MVVVHQSGGNQGGVKKCPLWVISGHRGELGECPLYLQKLTWIGTVLMSAKCQKQTFANSFDYPIGERQKVGWNFMPYRFGCLEVEHQFECSWLLNG